MILCLGFGNWKSICYFWKSHLISHMSLLCVHNVPNRARYERWKACLSSILMDHRLVWARFWWIIGLSSSKKSAAWILIVLLSIAKTTLYAGRISSICRRKVARRRQICGWRMILSPSARAALSLGSLALCSPMDTLRPISRDRDNRRLFSCGADRGNKSSIYGAGGIMCA